MRAAWTLVLSLAVGAIGAGQVHADTASVARELEGEEAECKFLLLLCVEANRARERADATPPTADVLAFKQEREAELAEHDAVEAARIIRKKHGGARPSCFRDPECTFLRDAR